MATAAEYLDLANHAFVASRKARRVNTIDTHHAAVAAHNEAAKYAERLNEPEAIKTHRRWVRYHEDGIGTLCDSV